MMNVICLQDEAFYAIIEELHERLKEKNNITKDKWIDDVEAMALLKITAKSTLQNLRDEGKIRYSQPSRKIILYDRDSIIEYIEKHVKEPF